MPGAPVRVRLAGRELRAICMWKEPSIVPDRPTSVTMCVMDGSHRDGRIIENVAAIFRATQASPASAYLTSAQLPVGLVSETGTSLFYQLQLARDWGLATPPARRPPKRWRTRRPAARRRRVAPRAAPTQQQAAGTPRVFERRAYDELLRGEVQDGGTHTTAQVGEHAQEFTALVNARERQRAGYAIGAMPAISQQARLTVANPTSGLLLLLHTAATLGVGAGYSSAPAGDGALQGYGTEQARRAGGGGAC